MRALARLSLSPDGAEYVGADAAAAGAAGDGAHAPPPTPDRLEQSYAVLGLEHKLDALLNFVLAHRTAKTIVFLSTCAQVRQPRTAHTARAPLAPVDRGVTPRGV